jgi:hypothetical protein
MAKKDAYTEFLKQDFKRLFDQMELNDIQRHFLGSRWLDQVLWMEKKASRCQKQHYRLRLTAIVLGVLVPVMIGFEFENEHLQRFKKYLTIGMGSVVAVSAAVEEFFHYGERWNHYRRTVESLKTQGWQFSQLSGEYNAYLTHAQAFSSFSQTIEEVIQRDVEVYVTQLSKPEEKSAQSEESENA